MPTLDMGINKRPADRMTSNSHAADSVRLRKSRNERYWERLAWRMHGRYDGLCHMYDASTTSA